MTQKPRLTFIYIAEGPEYQFMAVHLLASLREHFPKDVRAIGYCPEHTFDQIHPGVLKAHELMGAEIRPMRTEGMWDTPYGHGNKILAALQPRDSEYSAFVDSDVLFLKSNSPEELISPGKVSCSMAASMLWAPQTIWDDVYGAFDMPVPEERLRLMRDRRKAVVPYFSSGLVVFPEGPVDGKRFADVWYDTARILDRVEEIPKRRPYLDQISLPLAIRRAGLDVNILPEEQHYILGGVLRGRPLPEDRDIRTIHYRGTKILDEVGKLPYARKMLKRHTGSRYVRRLAPETATEDSVSADGIADTGLAEGGITDTES
ncbi:hypothetical protein [Tabrizicola sp.]|uniref:hypothetical protein n=1 Tax=Tabrizicola sp. TaxID=2005166 RepID=UPI00261EAA20|nr:hypothetical protein [Tabrizicola sp.]MDM7931729.1 hypothetical protein [Tabrizicola sp.]